MDNIYTPDLEPHHELVPLTDDVVRHVKALRLRTGERVRAMNGRGLVGLCVVEAIGSAPSVRVIERAHHTANRPFTLAMSVLDNRDRFEFALEKATELGISTFIPLLADRCQHRRVQVDRLKSKAVAAITQCGVPWLPVIQLPTSVDLLPDADVVIIGSDLGQPPSQFRQDVRSVLIVVGPEGDFSERELETLRKKQNSVQWAIGNTRLRAETAAIALLSNAVCAVPHMDVR